MKGWLGRLYPLFLLGVCVLAYGLWINRLGFYWDDFPLAWIARTYGASGLERYFSTNRPFWGLLYRLTTPLLGSNPLAWQIFALFWRWVSGLLLWQLVRLVWPRQEDSARWAAALFVVYPAFSEQYIALVYSHFFIVLSSFLGSLCLMLLAVRKPRAWGLWAGALALSALNLLCMEYFFLLDLLRPLLVWIALGKSDLSLCRSPEGNGRQPKIWSFQQRLSSLAGKRAGLAAAIYAPFLAIFLGVKIGSRDLEQTVGVSVNLLAFAGANPSPIFALVSSKMTVPKATILLDVQRPVVYLTSVEKNFGVAKSNQQVTNKIKNFLTSQGFEFTDQKDKADLWMDISTDSEKGAVSGSIHITYVTTVIRVNTMKENKEIYATTLERVKGYSLDYDRASQEAYTKSLEVLDKEKMPELLNAILQ